MILVDNMHEHRYKNPLLGSAMLIFEIHSTPRPQLQTRFTKRGRPYDPSKFNKRAIQWQISPHAPRKPIQGPVSVKITFYMPIPKSTSKTMRTQMLNGKVLPYKRPDIDNLAYIVTNAMKEIVYQDDSQIVDLILKKRYSDTPKTVVEITVVE